MCTRNVAFPMRLECADAASLVVLVLCLTVTSGVRTGNERSLFDRAVCLLFSECDRLLVVSLQVVLGLAVVVPGPGVPVLLAPGVRRGWDPLVVGGPPVSAVEWSYSELEQLHKYVHILFVHMKVHISIIGPYLYARWEPACLPFRDGTG